MIYDGEKTNLTRIEQQAQLKMDFTTFHSPVDHQPRDSSFDEDSNRFVAGEQFYNHEMYGSLRKGGTVDFYSKDCIGLIAGTATSMFSYQCLLVLIAPMMTKQMDLTTQQTVSVSRLIELPMALSFLFGLLSDCYPIMGLRRKGYMVLGVIINGVSVFVIAALSSYFQSKTNEERSVWVVVFAIIMAGLASIGCIITYLCVHTRVIELSQRESLRNRGSIQATYLIFRRFVSLGASMFTYFLLGTGTTYNVSLSTAMVLLAIISILPLPLILLYWKEEVYSLNTSVKVRGQIFWKIMQQKAVWRVMTFSAFYFMFLGIKFTDSTNVVRNWAGAKSDNTLLVKSFSDTTMLCTMLVWRYFFMNRSWPAFYAMAPFFAIIPHLIIATLVCFDVERNRYIYRVFYSMTYVADGINLINTIAPLTEIIQEGSEGATVGLSLTLQRCINIFVSTNAVGLWRGDNFYDTVDVAADASNARAAVYESLLLNFAINALAFFGLFFLPSQKLDAQQLRMYGGFTKLASSGILFVCLALFLYGMAINIMTFVPGLSCIRLAGGSGC